jgi:hypothetical protein
MVNQKQRATHPRFWEKLLICGETTNLWGNMQLFDIVGSCRNGPPREIRTPDTQVRSLVLYPAELWADRTRSICVLGLGFQLSSILNFKNLNSLAARPHLGSAQAEVNPEYPE